MPTRIMVVDDERSMCEFMQIMLAKEGYDVSSDISAENALRTLSQTQPSEQKYDLVISDLMMPEMSGIDLLTKAKSIDPDLDFIVMTAFASVETAIEALKKGAFDYVTKPFQVDEVKLAVKKIEENKRMKTENILLRKQLTGGFEGFLTNDSKMKKIIELCKKVADSDTTILIQGESGVGKEVLSRAIHHESNRKGGPFISVNCGALPENLLESELFGHVKGSFTGAIRNKEGLFKAADNGTILLDEIGETSPAIQVKLLRVLEEKAFTPIGDTKNQQVDVRIITATNANLDSMVKAGTFRPDLFYRLNVFPVTIPPLRERQSDITMLAHYFVKRHCAKMNIAEKEIAPDTIDSLHSYRWPGNVRQLENMLERAVLLAKGNAILPSDLPELADINGSGYKVDASDKQETSVLQAQPSLEIIEKAYISYILSETDWQKAKAAKILGIDASTLYRKIERYGLKAPEN